MSSQPIPQTISHYRILGEISRGGMGIVYRALDVDLGREVALKVLPPNLVADSNRRRRFVQEARAAAALDNPHVGVIHEIGEAEGTTFIAMELIRGESLSDMMSRDRDRLEPLRAVELALEIAEGLARAHERGILHRDLKPGNVMVTEDGHAKIIDFGLAKLTEPSSGGGGQAESMTETGMVIGTAAYMSPEQARGTPLDHRSDIFSFGILLHEMLAGERPFQGDSHVDTLHAILHSPARNLDLPSGNLPDLQRILDRCLAKLPADRYKGMKDVIVDLRAAWRHLESGSWAAAVAHDTLPTEAVPTQNERPAPAHPAPVPHVKKIVAAALGLLGILAAVWTFRSRSGDRIESLAVLPLKNLSGEAEQEYFADGLTEALIADLARIRALRVISRTSAMRYKDSKETLPEIARQLGVDAVVEGSVLRSGDRVRITAQLIEADTDRHLWSESYERDVRDVLALQSEVARAIAREVQVALTPQEEAGLRLTRTVDPEAYQLHLKGRYMWNKRSREGFDKALTHFQEAIALDPQYAPAHAGVADTYNVLASVGYDVLPPHEAMPKARAAALKALELDPNLAEAHASLAWIRHRYDWDWVAAEDAFRKAIELNPGYATAHQWYSEFLSTMGRPDEALAEAKRAKDLDPLSLIINHNVARRLYYAWRFEEAVVESRKTLEMDSQFHVARTMLGMEYAALGKLPEAIAEFETVGAGSLTANAYGRAGQREKALRILGEMNEAVRTRHVSPSQFVFVHLGLGQKDEALAWLEKAFAARSDFMVYLKVEPLLDPLRSDPRFQDLLRRVGLPEAK